MNKPLRIGILGAGWAGSSHAAAFSRLPDVEVTGLWNRTRSKAADLAKKLNLQHASIYNSWEEMVLRGDIDVLSVATPTVLRYAPIERALQRGLHVLTEKPFASSLQDARALTALAQETPCVTAVSFNWRYSPGNQVAYRAIQKGRFGALQSVNVCWRVRFTGDLLTVLSTPWSRQRTSGGGLMRQAGCHDFDRIHFLTGLEFTRVVSQLTYAAVPGADVDDGCLLLVELSNKASGAFSHMVTAGQAEWQATFISRDGTLAVTHEGVTRQYRDDATPVKLIIPEADQVPDGVTMLQHTWNRLVEDFCHAIREGDVEHKTVPYLPSFQDGLRTEALITAAERAYAERRWVRLDELAIS